ncbi:TlpA family protein disulfide reductase [Bhargavaea beijingensis]|uniref:Thiol-disulfide isomerase or thioredoxin n=1 Tax=Bhargavaea beijingensis TaxID=426756 RepID=A0A1G6XNL3_9BACL|nr:TlpA disulfide reductase family protein [Bhargavaea beijingensis]MCW1928033.1 TlpA family protein disulfide reductase [Bhargavaea beijingensis]RSK34261.1 TlpA family protein disulfide reductase [Bhargavaea beijingensis]SDD79652.1 Thiol-disulfide isomerase or thioredoxin [Bhargavaea beijingensis]
MKLRTPMPELDGATDWLNGVKTRTDLVGERPTLIHFWSVSCGLCKDTMPHVSEIRDKYVGRLNVIAIHMPRSKEDNDPMKIREAAAAHGITQPIFVDGARKLTEVFGNRYVPAYYVFDTGGRLRHYQAGEGGMLLLEKRIIRLLEE